MSSKFHAFMVKKKEILKYQDFLLSIKFWAFIKKNIWPLYMKRILPPYIDEFKIFMVRIAWNFK